MMAGPEGREHLAWWQQHLAGELPVLALRTDHPRPAVRGFSGATIEASIDPSLSERLRALARSQRVSLSTLLLGTLQSPPAPLHASGRPHCGYAHHGASEKHL